MNVKVENLEHNMAKLVVEVEAEALDKAIAQAYKRQRARISVPGFRKGKVPQSVVEKIYGPAVFYEEAANILINQEYPGAYNECGLDIVSSPSFAVTQIEKGSPFIFTAEVAVKPGVELGEYKGITVTKVNVDVTDEDVEEEIDRQLKTNARTVTAERAAESGDTVIIDFDGSIDGVEFDGGKGENYALELGSHSFIDNFEDQLVGKSAGDELDVHVTFPENYHEPTLAGKPAVFAVKVHEVKTQEMPELDEEYIQDTTEFDTVEEYKEDVRKQLQKAKDDQAKRAKEDEALKKIIDQSKMDIPDAMVDTQINSMINEYAQNLAQTGMSFQQYLQFSGMDLDAFKQQSRPEALQRIQSSLCLEEIAKQENIEATDEDFENRIKELAQMYRMNPEELKKTVGPNERASMNVEIRMMKAVDLVMENVVEQERGASDEGGEE